MSMGTITLFGATGYTGHLTAKALCERGVAPVLAGRDRDKLERLSTELGGLAVRVAEVTDRASMEALVREGDVLISTVGPFCRYGTPALEAAVAAGAHYVDATGEMAFAREVIEHYGPRAAERGVSLHTACGYDYVPGNCAAAVALDRAPTPATRVDVGYYATGDARLQLSEGTMASMAEVMLEPGVFWRGGRHVERSAGTRLRRFRLGGVARPAMSISSTEHIYLPRSHPRLRDVNVYLGWFGVASYLAPPAAAAAWMMRRVPGLAGQLKKNLPRVIQSKGRGPDAAARARLGSHVVATAHDQAGTELARADLVGVHGYTFTANMLALIADRLACGQITGVGALDPVSAFGLDGLVAACAEAGLPLRA